MLISNVHFILENHIASLEAAVKGLECVDQVVSMEADIIKAMKATTRDLTNNKIRCLAKIQNRSAWDVRVENPILSAAERMQKQIDYK